MLYGIAGFMLGLLFGVVLMCLLQIQRMDDGDGENGIQAGNREDAGIY